MKKGLSIILSVVMLLSITAGLDFSVYAASGASGDFLYSVLSDGTAEITGYTGNSADLVIPSTIDGYNVTSIADNAFPLRNMQIYMNRNLKSLIISEGITHIGKCAISFCLNLSSLTLPSTLTYIDEGAFGGCTSLESIVIPNSVACIDDKAFQGCPLKKIIISNPDCTIGTDAFYCESAIIIYGCNNSTAQEYALQNNISFVPVSADTLGGSIRVSGNPGLRFGFSYDKTLLEDVEEYGFVYSYSQTDDLTVGADNVKIKSANNILDHGDYLTFNLVFTNIPKSAFEQMIRARAYVKICGQYFYSDVLERSFAEVANAALADSSINQSVKDCINNILNEGM